MAVTSKYGFEFQRHLTPGVETPATLEVIIANSEVLTVGDFVRWDSGYLAGTAIDTSGLGILQGFVTEKGENIFKTNETIGGTLSGDDTWTAAADNITVGKVKGVVYVDPMALFFAYANGALTQAMVGEWFNGNVADGTYVDSLEYSSGQGAWSVGTQQFQLVELITSLGDGSASTTTGLFRIGRSQLLNDVTA